MTYNNLLEHTTRPFREPQHIVFRMWQNTKLATTEPQHLSLSPETGQQPASQKQCGTIRSMQTAQSFGVGWISCQPIPFLAAHFWSRRVRDERQSRIQPSMGQALKYSRVEYQGLGCKV